MPPARGPVVGSLVVMFVLGCGSSDTSSSSGGCGETGTTTSCDIVAEATLCGDRITVECLDGSTREGSSGCEKARSEGDQVIYCCTNAADEGAGAAPATTNAASASVTASTDASSAATTDAATTASSGGGGEGGS